MVGIVLHINADARAAATKAVEQLPHTVWNSPTREDARQLADAALAAAVPHLSVNIEQVAKFLLENEPEFSEEPGAWERYDELAQRVGSDAVRDQYRKFARRLTAALGLQGS